MSEYEDGYEATYNSDPLREAFEIDPVNTIAYIANEAASQAATAMSQGLHFQNQDVRMSQAAIVGQQADQMMASKYGDQWSPELRQSVAEVIGQNPQLISEEVALDPNRLASAFEVAAKAAAHDSRPGPTVHPSFSEILDAPSGKLGL